MKKVLMLSLLLLFFSGAELRVLADDVDDFGTLNSFLSSADQKEITLEASTRIVSTSDHSDVVEIVDPVKQ
ncbi:MAG: hypothetical protein LBS81_03650 [Endomicrobium sp.]|jgi:hypothetical protein|nr:hypothetical protein [Endomicrobium sp.]